MFVFARTMDQLYRQERNNLATLKKEISFHKELQKEAQFAKEEAKMLRQKLGDLKNVDLVVNGNYLNKHIILQPRVYSVMRNKIITDHGIFFINL